jgi:CBS domain containing-hemolysin-like protein
MNVSVRDANKRLNLQLPDDNGYATIAGFLMAQAGLRRGPATRSTTIAGSSHVERR